LHDLSFDCIAELFSADANGTLIKFESLLHNLSPPPSEINDQHLFFTLKAYVNKFVSFRLMKLLGEADPEGRRIIRNIREAVRNKRTRLRLVSDFRGEVLACNNRTSSDHRPEFPSPEFEAAIIGRIKKAGSMTDTLEKIAVVLSEQRQYRESARLVDVVQIIKRFYANVFFLQDEELERDEERPAQLEAIDHGNIERLRESTLRFVAEKINTAYYQKRKIDQSEARGLLLTMSDLLDDWLQGTETDHDYFQYAVNKLACTEQEYKERWATVMHYMVKLMRGHIREELESMSDE
jgi:hypothetical protein